MGRQLKLTPSLQKRFCKAIASGNYYGSACAYVGISYNAFRRWMARGKKPEEGTPPDTDYEKYRSFRRAVIRAKAKAELDMVALWKKSMPENWQAIRDFMDRRYHKKWGSKAKVEHAHGGNAKAPPIKVKVDDTDAKRSELAAIVAALAERQGSLPPVGAAPHANGTGNGAAH